MGRTTDAGDVREHQEERRWWPAARSSEASFACPDSPYMVPLLSARGRQQQSSHSAAGVLAI